MNRRIAIFALIFVVVLVLACSVQSSAQVNPCSLLKPSEVESALGAKVSGFDTSGQISGMQTCSGVVANRMQVMVMFAGAGAAKPNDAKWADPLAELERQSRESAKSIGAQMDVKRFGDSILCTTLVPPKQGPYATQCMAVKKPTGMASISVLVAKQQDMVPIEKLHPLAEKMLGRF